MFACGDEEQPLTTWARENSNLEKIIFYIRDVKWV